MKYGDLEANVLACLLLKPKLMENLKVEEKHFKRFNDVFVFFQLFYKKYKTIDVGMMFNVVKSSSQYKLIETIEYLSDIFVTVSHFDNYEEQLLNEYRSSKKDNWLRKKIYDKTQEMYVGNISVDKYIQEILYLEKKAREIDWN